MGEFKKNSSKAVNHKLKKKVYPTRIWILLSFYSVVCQDVILMEDVLVIPNLMERNMKNLCFFNWQVQYFQMCHFGDMIDGV